MFLWAEQSIAKVMILMRPIPVLMYLLSLSLDVGVDSSVEYASSFILFRDDRATECHRRLYWKISLCSAEEKK